MSLITPLVVAGRGIECVRARRDRGRVRRWRGGALVSSPVLKMVASLVRAVTLRQLFCVVVIMHAS